MSLKRGATTELNHENWNQEEKPEEKGNFAHASSEELQNRVIKKAKRKLTEEETTNKSVFSGFKGFGSIASASTVSSTSSPFSFLSKLSSSSTATVNSTQKESTKQGISATSDDDKSEHFQFDHSATYYANLKALNQAVSKWIKQHVDENPLCILSPIFQDYEKYLTEINDKQKNGNTFGRTNSSTEAVTGFKLPPIFTTNIAGTSVSSSSSTFTFSTVKPTDNKLPGASVSTPATTTPNIGIAESDTPFSFSVSKTDEATKPTGFSGFTFSSTTNKPFSFANQSNQQSSSALSTNKQDKDITTGEEDDTDDQPPKVEFTPVTEEGSVYSKRCKVFIKDDNNYKDLGVGTLHLKPLKDKDKTQLIVRADTSIGKILLNLILNDGIPTQRMGKNNVMMVCVPTPEVSEQKAVAVLLRVKTGEEADELLETINKYKK